MQSKCHFPIIRSTLHKQLLKVCPSGRDVTMGLFLPQHPLKCQCNKSQAQREWSTHMQRMHWGSGRACFATQETAGRSDIQQGLRAESPLGEACCETHITTMGEGRRFPLRTPSLVNGVQGMPLERSDIRPLRLALRQGTEAAQANLQHGEWLSPSCQEIQKGGEPLFSQQNQESPLHGVNCFPRTECGLTRETQPVVLGAVQGGHPQQNGRQKLQNGPGGEEGLLNATPPNPNPHHPPHEACRKPAPTLAGGARGDSRQGWPPHPSLLGFSRFQNWRSWVPGFQKKSRETHPAFPAPDLSSGEWEHLSYVMNHKGLMLCFDTPLKLGFQLKVTVVLPIT